MNTLTLYDWDGDMALLSDCDYSGDNFPTPSPLAIKFVAAADLAHRTMDLVRINFLGDVSPQALDRIGAILQSAAQLVFVSCSTKFANTVLSMALSATFVGLSLCNITETLTIQPTILELYGCALQSGAVKGYFHFIGIHLPCHDEIWLPILSGGNYQSLSIYGVSAGGVLYSELPGPLLDVIRGKDNHFLTVTSCYLTEEALIGVLMATGHTLELSKCGLSRTSGPRILNQTAQLSNLDIEIEGDSEQVIGIVSKMCPELESLKLPACAFTPAISRHLLELKALRHLDLRRTAGLRVDQQTRLPHVKSVYVRSARGRRREALRRIFANAEIIECL